MSESGTHQDDLIDAKTFDEAGYLRINQDVAEAIERGDVESGYIHYVAYGMQEGRSLPGIPREPRNRLMASAAGSASASPRETRFSIDSLIIAPDGGVVIVGWINDVSDPVSCIRMSGLNWRIVIDAARFVRLRRRDVEEALGSYGQHAFGFFGFLHFTQKIDASVPCTIELWLAGGIFVSLDVVPRIVDDIELRNILLAHLGTAAFFGNAQVERVACLGHGFGDEIVRFNKAITRRMVASPYAERFGPAQSSPRGTIVVCLYGKPEFLFLQNCLFAGLPGIEDYEFIYVCNSPELAETLLREARSASLVYGLSQSVMILPGNAGFSGANNAAARIARSRRLLAINPDVFPRDRDWAKKHTDLLDTARPEQSRIFGVPLYYDDGSLMHGGMYFDVDVGLSLTSGTPQPLRMPRVEHYGKGAPNNSPQFTRPRPVPAISGAFISIDRSWFEQLGGLSEDYVFGHYEDADLCLQSINNGTVPWLQDIRMWHLEGKGSIRRAPHEGGSVVNRWLFSRKWLPLIEAGLAGPTPSYPVVEACVPPESTVGATPATRHQVGRKVRTTG